MTHTWQPIDTAPRDGRKLLLGVPNSDPIIGWWCPEDDEGEFWACWDTETEILLPNEPHWWYPAPPAYPLPVAHIDIEVEEIRKVAPNHCIALSYRRSQEAENA